VIDLARLARSLAPVVLLLAASSCAPPTREDAAEGKVTSAQAAALHEAARAGDVDEARRLIEQVGTPVDAGDRYGSTALLIAADRGHVDLARYLLEAGADVNRRESFFNTSAFDYAVWRERFEVLPVLLAAGADQREDAIDLALRLERPELVRAAVEAGPIYETTLARLQERDDLPPPVRELLEHARTRPEPAPPVYDAEQLAQFEGSFETWDADSGRNTLARVEATAAGLRLVLDDGSAVELAASGDREFRSADGAIEASFWGRLGTVESLTVQRADEPPMRMRHSIAEPVGAEGFAYGAADALDDGGPADGHWPQFRGRRAAGVGDGSGYAAEWDVERGTAIRFSVEIPGLGNSSPIVWGDRILVTTAVAEGIEQDVRTGLTGAGDPVDEQVDHSWRVMAFDRHSGEALWDTEVGRAVPLTRRHFKASQASSTPVTDGTHVVAVFPTVGIACLDLDGRLLWKHELGGLNSSSPNDPGIEWGYASSPVIHDGSVIALVDTYDDPYIAAWDLDSGELRWKTERDGPPSWSTPTVSRGESGDELVVNGATIRGYDPDSGAELWSLAPNSELVIATPVVGDGTVYVTAGYAPVKPIYAVRLGLRGRFEVEPGEVHAELAWSHARGGAYMPTPLLYRGLLYFVHHNGRLVAYDAASGNAIYKTRFSAGGTFTASPVAADGKLYIGTEEGQVYVVAAGPEYRELAVNEMGAPLMATPALSGGTIYLRTTRRLVAVGS